MRAPVTDGTSTLQPQMKPWIAAIQSGILDGDLDGALAAADEGINAILGNHYQ